MRLPVKKFIHISILALIAMFTTINAYALLSIRAGVDKDTLTIDDDLHLTVTISGDSSNMPEPGIPRIAGFGAYSSGRSQQISIINGRITTSVSYTFVLTPRLLGTFTIPAITVNNGKEITSSQPITINVVNVKEQKKQNNQQQANRAKKQYKTYSGRSNANTGSSGQSGYSQNEDNSQKNISKSARSGEEIFVRADVNKKSVYPGEQFNLSITFYNSIPLASNPQYFPPAYKNLIAEDLPPVRNSQKTIDDTLYNTSEIKTALFAISQGKAEISPATINVQIPTGQILDPFDPNFFQSFMTGVGGGEPKDIKSKQISIEVKPLPTGAPQEFSGAVGVYSMHSSLEKGGAKEGEAINFSVSISGKGNLKSITAPEFPDQKDFKVFDTVSSLNITKKNDEVSGKKTFTYLLVPKTSGKKIIPSLKFAFFNPETEKYSLVKTAPVSVDVEKGDKMAKNVYFNENGTVEQGITPSGSDIKYVTNNAAVGAIGKTLQHINRLPLALHTVPVVFLGFVLLFGKINKYKNDNPSLFKYKQARGNAYKNLDKAEELLKDGMYSEAISLLYDAFMDYLSDKCSEKISALTMRKALSVVKQRFPKTGEAEIECIKDMWSELEFHHYAPGKADKESAGNLIQRYKFMLELLDGKLK